jgi:hypothetical protein
MEVEMSALDDLMKKNRISHTEACIGHCAMGDAEWRDSAEKAAAELAAKDEAIEAAKKLFDKMQAVYDTPEYMALWSLYNSHFKQYTGENWIAEQWVLRVALAKLDALK